MLTYEPSGSVFGAGVYLDWPRVAAEVAVRLAAARQAQCVTQQSLADASGLTRSNLQSLEYAVGRTGRPTNPTVQTLYRAAHALGVPAAVLLPEVDRPLGLRPLPDLDFVRSAIVSEVRDRVSEYLVPISTRISPGLSGVRT